MPRSPGLLVLVLVLYSGCGDAQKPSNGDPISLDCDDPTPILLSNDTPSGFERCSDGFIHRAEILACTIPTPPETCSTDGGDQCTSSAECDAAPNGACLDDPSYLSGCRCVYGCQTDADCGAGQICACAPLVGEYPTCVNATCTSSADCDGLCGLSVTSGGCGEVSAAVACLDDSAECRRTSCAPVSGCFNDDPWTPSCRVVGDGWACYDDSCDGNCG